MQTTVQGAQIYYNERGTGTPTLFLHGVPDSAEMWNPIIDRLQANYRCIALDLPGLTTRSQLPAGFDFKLPSMANFVDGFVTALGINEPINLVFGDFGAVYGLTFAITHPNKVRKIAITGGIGFTPDYQWHSTAKTWRTPILGEVTMMMMNEGLFKNAMKSAAPSVSAEHWHDVYELSAASGSIKRNILRQYRAIDTRDYATWEPKLLEMTQHVPLMVLWGDKDQFIAPSFAERFGAQTVQHYPNYGHWLANEAPDEVAAKIVTFFG